MSKGISNLQIENAIRNIGDEDLDDNFAGVFLSNHMNKFINEAAMVSGKKGKKPTVKTRSIATSSLTSGAILLQPKGGQSLNGLPTYRRAVATPSWVL